MDTPIARKERLERLHGIRFERKNLVLWVTSSGCTGKDDFQIRLAKAKTAPTLEIVRIKPDLCKAVNHVVELSFSWEELGLDAEELMSAAVKVANTFASLG
ncbi:hypothetical protein F2P44_14910 [Massilia sp. CCM 8695]|uniref:Uncharacterized protein n=1 Tax=Massilia frigida TaxID=2609281 RepID=A0ABX0NCQ5_9BURK|nr:hypothetical protein [Massilia frigida]NHZ80554.1 hypothetical protein [Massilia frigida]